MNKLSLVICTRNRLSDILKLFDSIKDQTTIPHEIVIVDSSDKKLIKYNTFNEKFNNKFFRSCNLIYEHTKPGLPYQRTVGISLATKDLISFSDDDVILDKNYFLEILNTFDNNPQYGGGMGTVVNVNPKKWTLYKTFRRFFLLQVEHASGKYTLSGMPTHPFGTKKFTEVEVLNGCATYKAYVLKKHQPDLKLGSYAWMEVCDLAKRVGDEYPLFFNPNAKFVHLKSPANRDALDKNHAEYIKNYRYLFYKNFYPKNKWKIFFYYWSLLGLFIEAIIFSILFNKKYLKGYVKGIFS
jgi:GT2 family glycosyltransferase